MAEVREKTPFELRDEKRMYESQLSTSDEEPNEKLSHEGLFNYFKRKALKQIQYHLNAKQAPKKRGRISFKNPVEERDPSPPARRSRSQTRGEQKKRQRSTSAHQQVQFDETTPQELDKVKAMLSKRVGIIEAAISVLTREQKQLQNLKVNTNREQIVKIIHDIEGNHESVSNDLETLLISLHEADRQIDKFTQSKAWELKNAKQALTQEMQQALAEAQKKATDQNSALRAHNEKLKQRVQNLEHDTLLADKVKELERKLEGAQHEIQQKQAYIQKHANDSETLNSRLANKNNEVNHLMTEIHNLKGLLRSQAEENEAHNKNLTNEIHVLTEQLKSASDKIQQARQSEASRYSTIEQDKDREIQRLKQDLMRIQDELNTRARHVPNDGLRQENAELKREVQRLNDVLRKSYNGDEVARLRQALDDQERGFSKEREELLENINQKEKHRLKQKNEWAEIYTGLKQEIKELRQKVGDLSIENERLVKMFERNQTDNLDTEITIKAQNDTLRARLKDKDHEVNALWEVLQELQRTQQARGKIDFRDIQTLLVIKNIDDKARRRLK